MAWCVCASTLDAPYEFAKFFMFVRRKLNTKASLLPSSTINGTNSMTPVVMIAGDGIGPEVMAATQKILQAAGAHIDWIEALAGLGAVDQFGEPLPDATLDLIRKYRVALKGPCTTPIGKGFRSINVRLRRELQLYASVRPVKTLPGIDVPYKDVDLIVVRENTEGLYAGLEHFVVPGVVESLRLVTRAGGRADHPLRLRIGPHAGTPPGHGRAQGGRVAALRRHVPGHRPGSCRRLSVHRISRDAHRSRRPRLGSRPDRL